MAKGLENAVVVTIEHGTGSGLIFNGKLYRGSGISRRSAIQNFLWRSALPVR
jgi:predicted NBD/HSP70 family sugar kinase